MNISLVICTKDRPYELTVLLKSIIKQSVNMKEIIIVDGSTVQVEKYIEHLKGNLPIKYFHVNPPGLTRQRNFGISKVSEDADWVGFLDDDLELEIDCMLNLENFIKNYNCYSGVGLKINNQKNLGKNLLREFMLLDKYPGGVVTFSGAAALIRPIHRSLSVEWLYGGATFWRREILQKYKFDEWFSGVGYCEDLDFSYRVSRHHQLAVCAEARCDHHHKEPSIQKVPSMGEWLVVAWWYFARVKHSFNPFFVSWGIFWMSLNNLLIGVAKKDKRRILMFKGNLQGLKIIFTGKVKKTVGFQK